MEKASHLKQPATRGRSLKRLTINFSEEDYNATIDTAVAENVTATYIVRKAHRLSQFVKQTLAEGAEINLVKADGTRIEVAADTLGGFALIQREAEVTAPQPAS